MQLCPKSRPKFKLPNRHRSRIDPFWCGGPRGPNCTLFSAVIFIPTSTTMATSLNITAGITLLTVEPGIILTREIATFLHHRTRRLLFLCLRNARCLARQWTGERGLLRLPDELLTQVVKQLEWQDLLQIRQTCQRLNYISKSLSVWRRVVEREPPGLLWLECPIGAYSSNHLEFLFLRRQRAELGYEMVAKGAEPRRQVIPVSMRDIAGPAHLVRGGRWLLFATHTGSIVYYDLEVETPVAQTLTPEHGDDDLVMIAVDMDPTSPTLQFNLAISRRSTNPTIDTPKDMVEVWHVGLVLDRNEHGISLRAERLASFDQEPPGWCCKISLLGEQLAMTISEMHDRTLYIVAVSWRSIRKRDYPKRIIHPATEQMCLLQPNVLLMAAKDGIHLTSLLSAPEVTTWPRDPSSIPQTAPFLTALPFKRFSPHNLSDRIVFSGSFRFLIHANLRVLAIIVRHQADGNYHIETLEILDAPDVQYDVQLPVSGAFVATWPKDGDVHLRQFSWEENGASSFPVAQFKASPCYDPYFQLFDIVSGRLLIPDAQGLALYDFTRTFAPSGTSI
ncbi:hypothetical protein BDN72DRAFT_407106 [Pluteus cervinus]|uniref:Uncharacterized protein n=1 Tax=Pluteus cervinus TaxID=181527 RepID=A0ACD3A8V6_9AGAR|nr:hypothetical protein BDN72DRAFT_407106 [Pluteus cervinus]